MAGRADIDAVHRPLPVGQGFGNAVDDNLDAADAETRARAEAPDRGAQVLGEVVSIEHEQAGHAAEGFIQAELFVAELNFVLADGSDCRRYLVDTFFDPDWRYRNRTQSAVLGRANRRQGAD